MRGWLRVLAEAVIEALDKAILGVVPGRGLLGFFLKSAPIDERIARLDLTRAHLADAIEAVEELQAQAQSNQIAVRQLYKSLDEAEQQRTLVQKDIDALREVAKLDATSLRKGLGIPTPGQRVFEWLLSFILGVAASLLAAFLWRFTPWG